MLLPFVGPPGSAEGQQVGHQRVSVREGMVLEKCIQPCSVRLQAGNHSGLGLQPLASGTASSMGGGGRRGKIITPR